MKALQAELQKSVAAALIKTVGCSQLSSLPEACKNAGKHNQMKRVCCVFILIRQMNFQLPDASVNACTCDFRIAGSAIVQSIKRSHLMESKIVMAGAIALFSSAGHAATTNSAMENSVGSGSTAANGAVSPAVIPFAQLDANKDGVLTKDELQSVPAVYDNFAIIDFNGDGKIIESDYYSLMSALEAGRAPALPEYATLDVNKDGDVSETEYRAFKVRLGELDKLMLSGKLNLTGIASGQFNSRGTIQGAESPAIPPPAAATGTGSGNPAKP